MNSFKVLGLALLASAGGTSVAIAQASADPIVVGLARDLNISEAEAERRAQIMNEAADLAARLETEEPIRFGGLYYEQGPELKVMVKLVGSAEQLLARYTQNPAFVAVKADRPLQALKAKQEALVRALKDSNTSFLVGVDVRTSRAVATVKRGGQGRSILEQKGLLGADAAVEEVDVVARKAVVYGGREIKGKSYATNRTGINYSDSTSAGFNVKNSTGTKGVTTAAHFDQCDAGNWSDGTPVVVTGCTPNQTATFVPDATSLTFRGQAYSAGHDVEWRSATDQTRFRNEIQYGGGGYAYTTMAITTVGTLRGALPACKQGITTFYTCGTTGSAMVTYQDADGIITGQYWLVARNGGGAMAAQGDSGGPVFASGAAYGTNVAVVEGGTFAGQLVVMPVQRFSTLGVTVLTAP